MVTLRCFEIESSAGNISYLYSFHVYYTVVVYYCTRYQSALLMLSKNVII